MLGLPLLGNIPNKGLEGSLIKSLSHPIERRAEVVDKLLAGVRRPHFAGQLSGLLDIWVTGFNPEKVRVRSKLLRALGRSREPCGVVVESLASARAITRPHNRCFDVIVRQGAATGEGEIGVLLNIGLVRIPRRLGSALCLKMSIDGYILLVNGIV